MYSSRKIKTLPELLQVLKKERVRGKKIVTTNGCFDILHIGHIKNLEWAKSQGDILVVGLNSDRSVRLNKGKNRPVIPARERAQILAALEAVDYVFIFRTKRPIPWIKKIKPDVHVKGAEAKFAPAMPKERAEVLKAGGKYLFAPLIKGKSTTGIIDKIKKL